MDIDKNTLYKTAVYAVQLTLETFLIPNTNVDYV